MVAPICPVSSLTTVGPQSNPGALTGTKYITPPAGTVIASFLGSDLADPYATSFVGLPKNLPVVPNRYFPVTGAIFPNGVDTSLYLVFFVPGNIGVQSISVGLG